MKKTIVLVAGILFTIAVSAQVKKTGSTEPASKTVPSKALLIKQKEKEEAEKNPMEAKKRRDAEAVEQQMRSAEKATKPNS